ncbi:uncharacterized protein LOC127439712 [Myxocyprinus asiaticus]|uniref:uncharacterized protein LOC127439712 n=1 Tax=Myxocyprinus asiaticus TaxID=70543 RepID=UPI002222781D|nr:uncharacterized protein LOC127439712 [Myxocyprinus asiaticus]
MDVEAALLRITGQKEPLRQSQSAGQGICEAESREILSDCASVDKDTETEIEQKVMSIKKEIKDEKDDVDLGPYAAETEFMPQIDQQEKGQEVESNSSESTDSTSKSDLSEMNSQQLQGHLSLAQSQQFLREEELRARQQRSTTGVTYTDPVGSRGGCYSTIRETFLISSNQLFISDKCCKSRLPKKQQDTKPKNNAQNMPLAQLALQVDTISGEWQQHLTGDLKEERLLFLWLLASNRAPCDGSMPVMNRSGLLSKAGLMRLLSSDEVWSLGRKRNQVELVPAEQNILQISESHHPPSSPSHRYSRQNQALLRLISPERIVKTDSGNTPCQQDSVKTLKPGSKTDEQETHLKVQGFYEDACTPKFNEACNEEVLAILQHPTERPLKPVLKIKHLPFGHEFDSDSERTTIESSLSSDTKEDLLFDSKSGHFKLKGQDNIKKTSVVHGSPTPKITALNVQNNQTLQSVLSLNNNLCDKDAGGQWKFSFSNPKTNKTCTDHEFLEEKTLASLNETVTDNPLIENLILEAGSADLRQTQDSPSCDTFFSISFI